MVIVLQRHWSAWWWCHIGGGCWWLCHAGVGVCSVWFGGHAMQVLECYGNLSHADVGELMVIVSLAGVHGDCVTETLECLMVMSYRWWVLVTVSCRCWSVQSDSVVILCRCWSVYGNLSHADVGVLMVFVLHAGVGMLMLIVSHAGVEVLMVIVVTCRCWSVDGDCVTCRCWWWLCHMQVLECWQWLCYM